MNIFNIDKILLYILAFLICLQANSVYLFLYGNEFFLVPILLIVAVLVKKRCISQIKVKDIVFLAGYSIALIFMYFVTDFSDPAFFIAVVLLFDLLYILFKYSDSVSGFIKCYINVMTLISTVALVIFIMGPCLSVFHPTEFYSNNDIPWGLNTYQGYFHVYFSSQSLNLLGYNGERNTAIYVEGPMYVYGLIFAIFYVWFNPVRNSTYKLIILITALVTTVSATGFVVLLCFLYTKFHRNIPKRIKVMLPVILVVVGVLMQFVIVAKMESGLSFAARLDDILSTMTAFINHPLLGVGNHDLFVKLKEYMFFPRYENNGGLSTGLGTILASGGIFWGGWYLWPVILAAKKVIVDGERDIWLLYVFLNVFMLTMTTEQLRVLCTLNNVLCWLIVTGGFAWKGIADKHVC